MLPRRLCVTVTLALVALSAYLLIKTNHDERNNPFATNIYPTHVPAKNLLRDPLAPPPLTRQSNSLSQRALETWLIEELRKKLLHISAKQVASAKENDLVDAGAKGSTPKFKIFLHPSPDFVSDAIRSEGYWKDCVEDHMPSIKRLLADTSRPNVVVDVGGNIGSCALMYAAMGLQVYSFEPAERNFRLFAASIQANIEAGILNESGPKSVTLFPLGAADKEDVKTIYTEEGNNGNSIIAQTKNGKLPPGISSISSDHINYRYIPDSILTLRVSDLVRQRVGFAKMDCQGFELFALRGMKELVERHGVDQITFEFAPLWAKNVGVEDPTEVLRILDAYGYTIVRQDGRTVVPAGEFQSFVGMFNMLAEELTAYSRKVGN
ncbi:S-adenosyl-L-methionine-dependent methyltransferase [Cladochytrium replicatum]|nr:S-adenosyl-L-methionine-dependent methyltransferase [Cladochytrium replicatum]